MLALQRQNVGNRDVRCQRNGYRRGSGRGQWQRAVDTQVAKYAGAVAADGLGRRAVHGNKPGAHTLVKRRVDNVALYVDGLTSIVEHTLQNGERGASRGKVGSHRTRQRQNAGSLVNRPVVERAQAGRRANGTAIGQQLVLGAAENCVVGARQVGTARVDGEGTLNGQIETAGIECRGVRRVEDEIVLHRQGLGRRGGIGSKGGVKRHRLVDDFAGARAAALFNNQVPQRSRGQDFAVDVSSRQNDFNPATRHDGVVRGHPDVKDAVGSVRVRLLRADSATRHPKSLRYIRHAKAGKLVVNRSGRCARAFKQALRDDERTPVVSRGARGPKLVHLRSATLNQHLAIFAHHHAGIFLTGERAVSDAVRAVNRDERHVVVEYGRAINPQRRGVVNATTNIFAERVAICRVVADCAQVHVVAQLGNAVKQLQQINCARIV